MRPCNVVILYFPGVLISLIISNKQGQPPLKIIHVSFPHSLLAQRRNVHKHLFKLFTCLYQHNTVESIIAFPEEWKNFFSFPSFRNDMYLVEEKNFKWFNLARKVISLTFYIQLKKTLINRCDWCELICLSKHVVLMNTDFFVWLTEVKTSVYPGKCTHKRIPTLPFSKRPGYYRSSITR